MSREFAAIMSCVAGLGVACQALPEGGVIVVSEPLDRISDKWMEVPPNSFIEIKNGNVSVQSLERLPKY